MEPISKKQLVRLQVLWRLHWKVVAGEHWNDGECRLARLGWIAGVVGRQLESAKDLTRSEAITVLDALAKLVPAHLVQKRHRPDRRTAKAYGTAGRRGQGSGLRGQGKEILLPGADAWAKLDAVLRAIDFNQERLAAFLRARTGPLKGRTKIYSLDDLNKVLWALEGIERRQKKMAASKHLQPAPCNLSPAVTEEVAAK